MTDFVGRGQSGGAGGVPVGTTAELAAVKAAISALLGGAEEYSIGTRRLRRTNLAMLQTREQYLEHKLAAETGSDVAVGYLGRR